MTKLTNQSAKTINIGNNIAIQPSHLQLRLVKISQISAIKFNDVIPKKNLCKAKSALFLNFICKKIQNNNVIRYKIAIINSSISSVTEDTPLVIKNLIPNHTDITKIIE